MVISFLIPMIFVISLFCHSFSNGNASMGEELWQWSALHLFFFLSGLGSAFCIFNILLIASMILKGVFFYYIS
jgi:hypothetical protein